MSENVEIIPGRLYWSSVRSVPVETSEAIYFSTDDLLIYHPYYSDFGPLNIAQVCRFCRLLNQKLAGSAKKDKRIVYCCRPQYDTRANAAFLMCSWSILFDDKTPQQAYAPFADALTHSLAPYRDASLGPPCFDLSVIHCLMGLYRGWKAGWLDPKTFDTHAYEYYERVENGDFNWIVPGKFLAFSGPTQTPIAYVDGIKTNTPETYFDVFKSTGVTSIIRFNNKVYDRKKFLDAGFNHHDLYFADGGNPTESIIKRFLSITETEPGAIAVHCKAGLGRTGTLIALHIMKHHSFSAAEVIGWLRICRPGSVIGPQQLFLVDMERRMRLAGEAERHENAAKTASPPPPAPVADDGAVGNALSCLKELGIHNGGPKSPSKTSSPTRPRDIRVTSPQTVASPTRIAGITSFVKSNPLSPTRR